MYHLFVIKIICFVLLVNATYLGAQFPVALPDIEQSTASNQKGQPHIALSTDLIPSFRKVETGKISEPQFYYIEAANIFETLVITAQSPLKISTSCHEGFSGSLEIEPPESGMITSQKIYVRAYPETTGIHNPLILHVSGNAFASLQTSVEGAVSQIPAGYYESATGAGEDLLLQLHEITRNHGTIPYSQIWTQFQNTDARFDGTVWDIFSSLACEEPPYEYTFFDDQDTGGSTDGEGDVYNREHLWPRSWWGGSETDTMFTDMHHIYPADKFVNAQKSNYPFGMINNPHWTSLTGNMIGFNAYGDDYQGMAFEPVDEFKGDFARSYFYMAARYMHRLPEWAEYSMAANVLDGQTYPGFQQWFFDLLYEWHINDPVSHKEIERNNAVFAIQGNRNPFIDHPEWVSQIWGDSQYVTVNNIADLRNLPADGTVFRYTGQAVIVAMDDWRNRKYIQDETAAILIDDNPGIITTEYELYDVITEIVGELNTWNNMLRFQPHENTPQATTNIPTTPSPFSLNDITSDDQAKLVKFENVFFNNINEGETFLSGTNYIITDGHYQFTLRTDFYNADYIGETIPHDTLDITGVIQQFHNNFEIIPRFQSDIASAAPALFNIVFIIEDQDGNPIEDAVITLGDLSNEPGNYSFNDIPGGAYSYLVNKHCYLPAAGEIIVNQDKAVTIGLYYDHMPGDANGDGMVNVLDIISIATFFSGSEVAAFCFHNADVNGDSVVNVLDLIATANIFITEKVLQPGD